LLTGLVAFALLSAVYYNLAIMHQGRIVRTGTPAEVAASQPARISGR
jgi:hypothetical protein